MRLIIFLSIYPWLYNLLLGLGRFFSFLIHTQSVELLGREISPFQAPACTLNNTNAECTQTSMSQVGFKPKAPVFERAKTVLALDRAATVIS
jgi:hypothetical protein